MENKYNKKVQDRYKAKCTQIAIRYGLNDEDIEIVEALERFCKANNCSRGSLARTAIREKLERDGYME
ncbi:MAG: hypothetical protein IJZ42_07175 [Lachnospiraceae bacterium]|nr:hypothetical protein [Lachnospiraceae bacterium]